MTCDDCGEAITPLPTLILIHRLNCKGPGTTTLPPLGPCQLQASPLCTGVAVTERLDPMAMAPERPAPAAVIPTCAPCFDARSQAFLSANMFAEVTRRG